MSFSFLKRKINYRQPKVKGKLCISTKYDQKNEISELKEIYSGEIFVLSSIIK